MREEYEFRINAKYADLLFSPEEGKHLGTSVKQVKLSASDPRFSEIGRLQREVEVRYGETFFFFWKPHRTYTRGELERADFFSFFVTACFEPTGEECGTIYDESMTCRKCGAASKQVSPLKLDTNRIQKSANIARTLANELVVSQRLTDLLVQCRTTGISLEQIVNIGRGKSGAEKWYQLVVTSPPVMLSSKTRLGIDPFDEDPKGIHRCQRGPAGHVAGLNVLSELFVDRESWETYDVNCTQEYVGTRSGVLRPRQLLLISSRLRNLLLAEQIRRFEAEVAYIV